MSVSIKALKKDSHRIWTHFEDNPHITLQQNKARFSEFIQEVEEDTLCKNSRVKDSFGLSMYENDIVEFTFKEGREVYTKTFLVQFVDNKFSLKELYRNYFIDDYLNVYRQKNYEYSGKVEDMQILTRPKCRIEVIGNAHTHSKLLD